MASSSAMSSSRHDPKATQVLVIRLYGRMPTLKTAPITESIMVLKGSRQYNSSTLPVKLPEKLNPGQVFFVRFDTQ